jgi:type VI secretion system Hcp family effector
MAKQEEPGLLQPAVYIQFGNSKIKGTVTEDNHKNWVEVTNAKFAIKRHIHTQTGHTANRDTGKPEFSAFSVSKPLDAAGALLAQEASYGQAIDKVVIHFCKTGSKGLVILQEITLSNVMLSDYSINTFGDDHRAAETFSMNYDEIEIKGYSYDSKGNQQTPTTFAYSISKAKPQ